jgi:hypothetical protein
MAWNSKTKIFGLPLVSAGFAAQGVFAFGFAGRGIFVIAQFGYGIFAITQFGFGVISISQFGFGFLVAGQFALGLIFALGQFALGFIATGINAGGYYRISGSGNIPHNFPILIDMVRLEPTPLLIWIGILIAIGLYLHSQRDKFRGKWKVGDIFRSRLRHSDQKIRIRALSDVTDTDKLVDILRSDPALSVKKAALKKISDNSLLVDLALDNNLNELHESIIKQISGEDNLLKIALQSRNATIANSLIKLIEGTTLLYAIIRDARLPSMKIAAALKIAKPDQPILAEIALGEKNAGVLNALLKPIKDRELLSRIASDAVSSEAKIIAINKLKKPSAEALYEVFLTEIKEDVREALIDRIRDDRVLARIISGDFSKNLKRAAIEQVRSKKTLQGLHTTVIDNFTRNIIEKQLGYLKPVYYSLKIEITCPYCSQPVFVNGPMKGTRCLSCLSSISLTSQFWREVRDCDFGVVRYLHNNQVIEKSGSHPKCLQCSETLDTDDIESGSRGSVTCASCGLGNSSFPVPEWFSLSRYADHLFCAEEEGQQQEQRDDIKPVSISCIKCGAPLEITVETPRNATCGYCNTVQYLPDPLWLSLHPVKKKHPWYIRCTYQERKRHRKLKR